MFEIYRSTVMTRGRRLLPLTLGLGLTGLFGVIEYKRGFGPGSGPDPFMMLPILYAIVVGSGVIAADVRDGSAALLLTRSVSRTGYLAGRFLGTLTVSAAGCAAMYAVPAVMAAARGMSGRPGVLAAQALTALASVIWVSAVLLFFSTFLPSHGDVLAALGIVVTAHSLLDIVRYAGLTALIRFVPHVTENIFNTLFIYDFSWHPALLSDLLRWSSNIAVMLTVAALVFRQREFSYAGE